MKNSLLTIASSIVILSACENTAETQSKNTIKEFTNYVDSIKKVSPEYTNAYWENIQNDYTRKEAKADAVKANLDESIQKEIEEGKAEFAAFKDQFKNDREKFERNLIESKKEKIRIALFGDDKGSDDLTFAWVNASNIVQVYKKFVDAVDANKKEYTEADWEIVKNSFKSLDDRRDAISKDLSGNDKLNITQEKVRFGTIKMVN